MSSESPAVSTLGRGMVHRGRRQTVLARKWSSAGLIGAVGRASVGFGLAVGRSRAIRPVVQVGDVNSAALRPPVDFWRPDTDEPDEAAVTPVPGAGWASAAGREAGAPDATLPAAASAPASPRRESARRPAVPTSRRVDPSSRPTWTEQVIQRSSIGYTAPAPGSPVPEVEVPDDFVSSGDPKLDHLRLLVRGRQQTASRRPADRTRERRTDRPRATPADSQPSTTRGDTSAGRSTGPGLFGRTIRPEPIEPSATGEVRRSPAVDAQLPTSTARASARRQPAARRAARRPSAPAPTKVDRLRALLVEQGILPADADADAAADAQRRVGSAAATRPGRVSPTGDVPARRPARQESSDTIRRSTSGDGSGGRQDPARSGGAPTGTADTPSASRFPSPSASGSPSASSSSGHPRAAEVPPVESGSPTAGPASVAAPGGSDAAPPPSVGRRAAPSLATTGDLRVRRMMSFGGTDQELADSAEPARESDRHGGDITGGITRGITGDGPFGEHSMSDPALPGAVVDTVRTPAGAHMLRRRHRHPWADQRPELPSAVALLRRPLEPAVTAPNAPAPARAPAARERDDGPPAVLRRVTLPRALSVRHRPEPVLRRHRADTASPTLPDAAVVPSDATSSTSGVAGGAGSALVARRVPAAVAGADETAPAGGTRTAGDAARTVETAPTGETAAAAGTKPAAGTAPAVASATADELTTAGVVTADVTVAAVRPHAVVRRIAVDDPAEVATPTSLSDSTSVTRTHDAVGAPPVRASVMAPTSVRRPATPDDGIDRHAVADRVLGAPATGPGGPSSTVRRPGVDRAVPTVRRRAARRRPSSVAGGPGALLDVVRRSSHRSAIGPGAAVGEVIGRTHDGSTPVSDAPAPVAPPAGSSAPILRTASSTHLPESGSPSAGPSGPDAPGPDAPAASSTAARDRGAVGAVDAGRGGVAVRRIPDEGRPRRAPTAAADLADRFMTELSQTIQRRPAPLPMPYRPMADVITPGRRVMLSTDEASRRALRSVGKVAATTDHVIHLDPEPIARHRLDEVIAHELTHVAHPSPAPRFFDDVDDSPEERRAEEVAKIMTSSPIAPGNSRPQPSVQRRAVSAETQPGTIRRSSAGTPTASSSGSSSSAPSMSADALAARITGRSSPDAVQRWATGATPSGPRPGSAPTIGASTERSARAAQASAQEDLMRNIGKALDTDAGKAWFEKMLRSNTSLLMSLLEDRIIVEAERRGGRTWRGA